MEDGIKRLTDAVIKYGVIVTEIEKDIKMLKRAEDAYGMDPKQMKKLITGLMTTSAFYVKKQEVVALELDEVKEV